MFKEYAVDPETIASSWETCRYLVELFGFHKGRLLSRFPKTWKKLSIEAAQKLQEGRRQERIVELLNQIGKGNNILISSGRVYAMPGQTWLDNAVHAHRSQPFEGIIASESRDDCDAVISAEDCTEDHHLLYCPRESITAKTALDLARPATLLLRCSRELRLIDAYFDPSQSRWRNSLKAFLETVHQSSQAKTCELHYLESPNTPDPEVRLNNFPRLIALMPVDLELRILRWKTTEDGEDFHARYILTENGGLRFDSGLTEKSEHQTTDVSILDKELHQKRWLMYNANASVYSLQSPIHCITCNGISEDNIKPDL